MTPPACGTLASHVTVSGGVAATRRFFRFLCMFVYICTSYVLHLNVEREKKKVLLPFP